MKRLSLLALVVSACLFPLAPADVLAQAPARFQQVIEFQVKAGQEMVFEQYLKTIAEAADKAAMKQYWSVFSVAVGKPGGTYRITLNFDKWGERDGWTTVPAVLAKAYGPQEAERRLEEGAGAVERSTWQVWEYSPAGSANAGRAGSRPAPFYRVAVRRIQADMAGTYEAFLAKIKPAYERSDQKPVVLRHVLRMGAHSGSTFRRTEPFNTWAEMDRPNPGQLLGQHFGAEAWTRMASESDKMTVDQETFISVFRPDLSRLPGAPSS